VAERQARIKADLDKAATDKEAAKALLETYQTKLKNAEDEAKGIIAEAKKNAEKRADAIVAEARQAARELMESAQKRSEAERQAALVLFRAQAARIVLLATGKLLRREITGEDAHRLADAALSELASSSDLLRRV
jgi:F-type H+-transporting ATPase subunit b